MTDSGNCKICGERSGRYSCPRCNLLYCSVSCYQSEKHIECSEIFYEKWVSEELKNTSSDPEAKQKLLEILKQSQEIESEESLDSDDEEITPDLASRLSNIDLDDEEAVWERLVPEEKSEFSKLIANGDIIKILPKWEPWWKTRKRKMLVQELGEGFDSRGLGPDVPSKIPLLSEITKTSPSPLVSFILLNILESYIFTVRWFRGAHKDLPVEAMSTCIALSAALRNNEIFKDSAEAVLSFEQDLSACIWIEENDYDRDLMLKDLEDIIRGSDKSDSLYCLKAAVSDLDSLCAEALTAVKTNKRHHLKRFSGPPPTVSHLQQISRRLRYYLSWSNDHGTSLINPLHVHVHS